MTEAMRARIGLGLAASAIIVSSAGLARAESTKYAATYLGQLRGVSASSLSLTLVGHGGEFDRVRRLVLTHVPQRCNGGSRRVIRKVVVAQGALFLRGGFTDEVSFADGGFVRVGGEITRDRLGAKGFLRIRSIRDGRICDTRGLDWVTAGATRVRREARSPSSPQRTQVALRLPLQGS
jgi:hypothetical protein